MGNLDKAISQYEIAISLNNHAMSYHSLSYLKTFKLNDPHILKIKSLINSKEINQKNQIHLCRALANFYEKSGDQNDFFRYLNQANSLHKKDLNYSINKEKKEFDTIKKIFDNFKPSSINGNSYIGLKKDLIFIIGMPRSGTSLVEQIISSHYDVFGAGELNTLTKLISPIIINFLNNDINNISQEASLYIKNQYLDKLNSLNFNERHVTDKFPLNFKYIGFILSVFPDAKIIHIKRDARATCWSNYRHYFESINNGYSNNFDDLADYYELYLDLMKYWKNLFPNKIYDMSYEELTINQEVETKNLIDYCNLQWDENCLNFHNNERAVRTISALQVRKKMYQGSSDSWKKYWSHIQPLINAVEKF